MSSHQEQQGEVDQQVNQDEEILSTDYDFLIKFMLLGDSGVGKTCFLHRYMEDEFRSRFTATVGVDFRLKKVEYDFPEEEDVDSKKKIHLQIWDTAGQERYRSLTKAFFRDGMGFLLLFDLSNDESFKSVRGWLGEIKEEAYCDNPDIILIGNKNDLATRAVTSKQAQELADNLDPPIPYMETSAASGENIPEAVNKLLDMVMKRMRAYVTNMDHKGEAATPSTSNAKNVNIQESKDKPEASSCPC